MMHWRAEPLPSPTPARSRRSTPPGGPARPQPLTGRPLLVRFLGLANYAELLDPVTFWIDNLIVHLAPVVKTYSERFGDDDPRTIGAHDWLGGS